MNMVMNFYKRWKISCRAARRLGSQDGICSADSAGNGRVTSRAVSVYRRFVIKDMQVASAIGLVDVIHASQRDTMTVAPVYKRHLSTLFRPAN